MFSRPRRVFLLLKLLFWAQKNPIYKVLTYVHTWVGGFKNASDRVSLIREIYYLLKDMTSQNVWQRSHLTPNMPLIHTWFTYSIWNMGEMCGLKFHLWYGHRIHHKKFYWNPSKRKEGHYYYCSCNFGHFYEVKKIVLRMEEFQNKFFLDHFSPSFLGQKC